MQAAKDSLDLAGELRADGLRVDVYPVRNVKLGTQMAYASKRGIPFVAMLGDDENARGEISVKDMRSGEQRSVKREKVAAELRKSLNKSE